MHYPTIGERVRVSRRVDEYFVISADFTVRVAQICLDSDASAVKESVPFSLLLKPRKRNGARPDGSLHKRRLANVEQVLQSSEANIHRSNALIADLQDSIATTMRIICTSQQLICTSDLAIARTRTLDCK